MELIKKEHFQNVWNQINRILNLKDAKGDRTSISDLSDDFFNNDNMKIESAHLRELNNKITEMRKDDYYKEDSKNYLITYTGDLDTTIQESLYTYLTNMNTNAQKIICRNLVGNTHGDCLNEFHNFGQKTNGKYSYGQVENSDSYKDTGGNYRSSKYDRCAIACSYGPKTNDFHPNEYKTNGPCFPEGYTADIYNLSN